MTNYDREGRIFLFHPPKNNGLCSCSPLSTVFYMEKNIIRIPESPEFAEMPHGDTIWASFRENLSSVFPTKRVSNQSLQLQRLARKWTFRLQQDFIWYFQNNE